MKHPIYKEENRAINLLLPLLKDPNKLTAALHNAKIKHNQYGYDFDIGSTFRTMLIFSEIMDNNHNYISIKDEDWKSDVTQKTLEKLKLKDINFAFKSGVINVKDKDIYFAYFTKETVHAKYINYIRKDEHTPIDVDTFSITYHNNKTNEVFYYTVNEEDNLFKNITDDFVKELVTIVMTVLIYASMYKNKSDRVMTKSINSKKNDKLKVPKHTVNQIRLIQKISNEKDIVRREGSKWKSNKIWLVKGHLRNQFYKSTGEHKLKFIDPFWKGEGIEEVEKIYNI